MDFVSGYCAIFRHTYMRIEEGRFGNLDLQNIVFQAARMLKQQIR